MRTPTAGLLLALAAAACSPEGPGAPEGPPRPEVVDDAVLDARIEDLLRERLLASTAALGDVLELRVTDDTPRIDLPEEDPRGEGFTFLRGASLNLPVAGADGLALTMDEDGLTVRLRVGPDEMVVRDGTGSPATARELERLRALGRDPWEGAWDEIEGEVARWAGDASDASAVSARIEAARARIPKWADPFEKGIRSMSTLRRQALRAAPADPQNRDLHPLYRNYRLGLLKQGLVGDTGGNAALEPFAAGPTEGFRSGVSGVDSTVVFSVGGPDDMVMDVRVHSLDGTSPVRIPEEALLRTGGGCRPFERSAAEAGIMPAGKTPLAEALAALSRFHLDPTADRAVALLSALRSLPKPQPDAELVVIARELGTWIGADGATAKRLQDAASGR